MRHTIEVLLLLAVLTVAAAAQNPAPLTIPNGLPEWAFNIPDKVQPPEPKVPAVVRAAGAAKDMEATAVAGNANPPDWFPDEHPAPPRSVKGPMPNACGSCHLMSGQGHPESADIAGMPAAYIVRQMGYFKSGARKEEARMGPIARAVSDEDVRQAAEYFAAVAPTPFVKVIETATPPKTYVSADARHRRIMPEGGTEPIGRRIIQVPDDPMRTTIRDPHSGFTAYVPPGSIAKGKALVQTGGSGRTIQCAICHGDALTGLGEVPRIAGLQPVYIARQLITMQNGTSAGANAALMKKPLAKLSEDDIIAIAAYLGSLPPR
ncbi:MAG TPA: c-type cytochrome [Vicinamibacterales bacterium]|nr:c-type cytochrome [Vicinamibacterales bacterium]